MDLAAIDHRYCRQKNHDLSGFPWNIRNKSGNHISYSFTWPIIFPTQHGQLFFHTTWPFFSYSFFVFIYMTNIRMYVFTWPNVFPHTTSNNVVHRDKVKNNCICLMFLFVQGVCYLQQKPTHSLQKTCRQSSHLSKCSTHTVDSHNGQCSVCWCLHIAGHRWQATTCSCRNTASRHPLTSLLDNRDNCRHRPTSDSGKKVATCVNTLLWLLKACHIDGWSNCWTTLE